MHKDDPLPTVKRQRAMKNAIYIVFSQNKDFVNIIKLEKQKTFTAKWYTEQ